jgi:hypothetical protein
LPTGRTARRCGTKIADPLASDLWATATRHDKGVTVWDPRTALRGFTVYTSGDGAVARLVTMTGDEVYEWSVPYSGVWNAETAAVKDPQPDALVFLRKVHVYPDGDLLALYEAAGHFPSGYGLVRVDKTSRPRWTYLQRARADFDIAADGRIFAVVQDFRRDDEPQTRLPRPFLEDFLVVLSPEGKELRRISLVAAMERSRFRNLLYALPEEARADPLDTNAVDYVEEAAEGSRAAAGQVLLSFRKLGALALLDPARGEIVWAAKGPWISQADAALLPEGEALLVEGDRGAARALRVSLAGPSLTWSYTAGDGDLPFAADPRNSAQGLANGNVLLTDASAGRLFEVDPRGTVVWEFTNPERAGADDARIPIVASGRRITLYELDVSFRGITRP